MNKAAAPRIVFVTAATAALISVNAHLAFADPITCPSGQVSAQTAPGVWDCVNNGGNASNAEDPRNPNAGKGDF